MNASQRYFGLVQDILSPLPFTVATERLATLVQKADAGKLRYSNYRFNLTLNGTTFKLYGPHGNRTWPLVTTGHLVSTSTGTQLSVIIRPSLLYPIIFAAGLGWWIWNAMSILRGAFLLFPIGAFFVAVVIVLVSVLSEKNTIIDMLLDVFSVESITLTGEELET